MHTAYIHFDVKGPRKKNNITSCVCMIKCEILRENPACGRHRISGPMQILAPIFLSGGGRGKGWLRPIQNTSPFLGLHARVRNALHQSTDKGRSAPVHAKKLHGKGTNITQHTTQERTLQLLDQIGRVGRLRENLI